MSSITIFKRIHAVVAVVFLMLLFYPSLSYAYIDPGIVGLFFQTVVAFIFGVLLFWFTKPIRYIKSLYLKMKERFSSTKNGDIQ